MRGRKRRNDIASREFDNVVHMYRKENASLKQIAHTYDVTQYVVRDLLVGMGVEIGPRGRPRVKPVMSLLDIAHSKEATEAFIAHSEGFIQEDRDVKKLIAPREFDTYAHDSEAVKELTQDDDPSPEKYKGDRLLDLGDFRRPLGEHNA